MVAGNPSIQDPPADEFRELKYLWRAIRSSIAWVIALVVVFAGALVTIAFLIPPIYMATVVVAPEDYRISGGSGAALGSLGSLASAVGVNIGGRGGLTDEALAVLESRRFLVDFLGSGGRLGVLYPKLWDSQQNRWRVPERAIPSVAQGARLMTKRILSVSRDTKSGLISIGIMLPDRQTAAAWANELVARLNREMRERDIRNAESRLEFLRKESSDTSVLSVRDALGKLIENELRQKMLANVHQEYVLRTIDPAIAPEAKEVQWPRKSIFGAIGLVLGFFAGVALSLYRHSRRAI